MISYNNLSEVCSIFNRHNVQYIVSGGYACALHGHVRATNDIDMLVKNTEENLKKILLCVRELFPDIDEDITIDDIRNNIVLKIVDRFEIDISLKAWIVEYEDAIDHVQEKEIDGVKIPFLGLDDLIKSKTSYREIDSWDAKVLSEIKKSRRE